jgi:hypothetical protein
LTFLFSWAGHARLWCMRVSLGPSAAREFGGQRIERLSERLERIAEVVQPRLGGIETGLIESVDPARSSGLDSHELGLAKHLEVLRDGRL